MSKSQLHRGAEQGDGGRYKSMIGQLSKSGADHDKEAERAERRKREGLFALVEEQGSRTRSAKAKAVLTPEEERAQRRKKEGLFALVPDQGGDMRGSRAEKKKARVEEDADERSAGNGNLFSGVKGSNIQRSTMVQSRAVSGYDPTQIESEQQRESVYDLRDGDAAIDRAMKNTLNMHSRTRKDLSLHGNTEIPTDTTLMDRETVLGTPKAFGSLSESRTCTVRILVLCTVMMLLLGVLGYASYMTWKESMSKETSII